MNKKIASHIGGKSVEQGGRPMPAKSLAQKKLMDAAAHNSAFAQKVGIPKSVATEYSEASKGMKFKGDDMKDSKAMAKKEIGFMKKKGAPKSMIKHEEAEYGMKKGGGVGSASRRADGAAQRGKTSATMVKMAGGGMAKKRCG